MINVPYTLFIFPIEQILELCFAFFLRAFNNPALSILGISFTVSALTLPLYLIGEKHQRSEREIQKRMKPEVDNIKAVFSGDERFMRLAVFYRQNEYHPLYSLRSSIPLIIQIPFFIAAYHFLSNLKMINGVSFGPIINLGKPDSLLTIKNFSINVLPIVMTLINLISATIYLKGYLAREKFQLYGIAALFLVLLYNSPSALVLYWTGNNLFSLVKNIIHKTKKAKLITSILIPALCLFLNVYLLIFLNARIVVRIFIVFFISVICLLYYFPVLLSQIKQKLFVSDKNIIFGSKENIEKKNDTIIFIPSLLILFILTGFVIPSSLIASSVQEFSFTSSGDIINPFIFIGNAMLQSAGIFLLWPLLLYLFFSQELKNKVTKLAVVICLFALINALFFPGNYGFMTTNFTFSNYTLQNMTVYFMNLFILAATVMLALLLIQNFKNIALYGLVIAVLALLAISLINSIKINKEFHALQPRPKTENETASHEPVIQFTNSHEPVIQFSKTGKNVLVILLDMAVNGYVPFIFNERPDLNNSFDGFTWYRNSISFGAHTIFGSLGIFGGYEYTPLEIIAKNNISLAEKRKEALLMLPRIFLDKGYRVTVNDVLGSYSYSSPVNVFDNFPEIHYVNRRYAENGLLESGYLETIVDNTLEKIKAYMIRFSFFKIAPLLFRNFIYDDGKWLNYGNNIPKTNNQHGLLTYVMLEILDSITEIKTDKFDTYTAIANDMPHLSYYLQLQPPGYVPVKDIIIGNGPFVNDEIYHVNAAALLLLGKWFDFLKESDVYDNTRIIIVSDHGTNSHYLKDNFILPGDIVISFYTPIFLVKDFNQHGSLSIDDSFMTNADVPIIALEGIVMNPVNPWTGKIIKSDKEDGITITTSHSYFNTKEFEIKPNEWLHVHTNIYNLDNWNWVKKP